MIGVMLAMPLTELLSGNGGINPQAALKRLMEGNQRYVKDQLEHPNRNIVRRESLTATQNPFAIILGCADSRVSPEIVFDQGIGDLFVVRVAGNVVGPIELDSIDYAAIYLKSSLIVVLGHENCGAVQAVLNDKTKFITGIADKIAPAIKDVPRGQSGTVAEAVKANVRAIVNQLKISPVLSQIIAQNKIEVIGGYYNLSTGEVESVR